MARILFVQPGPIEQIGLMSLSRSLRDKGHTVRLAYGTDNDIVKSALSFQPDVVAFTVLLIYLRRFVSVAQSIKDGMPSREPLVVFGGPQPTLSPEIVLENPVDLVCQGEGEGALADVLDVFEEGDRTFKNISNIVTKENGTYTAAPMRPLEDLDLLPWPDRELSFEHKIMRNDPSIHFAAGRGCPFPCTFCNAPQFMEIEKGLGAAYRTRSRENLCDEIDEVNKRWGIPSIYFIDDTFCIQKKWLLEFLEMYGSRFRIPFYCNVRADQMDEETAMALKDAGCYLVSFGIESGVQELRNKVLLKHTSNDRFRQTADTLKRANLRFMASNIVGLPHETLEDAISTLKFNTEIGTNVPWVSLYLPFPKTALAEKALEDGLIEEYYHEGDNYDIHTGSLLKQPEIDEVVRLHKFSYIVIKFPWTLPIVRKLITFNLPRVYYWVHRLTYFWFFFREERLMTWRRTIVEAVALLRFYDTHEKH